MMMAPARLTRSTMDGVGGRHEILEDARALRGADALGRGQVLDRLGQAVHPAANFAARKLLVARLGLRNQIAAVLQRDDGVDLGIERVDVIEVGVHHLDAGHLLRLDRARQRERVHHHDVGRRVMSAKGFPLRYRRHIAPGRQVPGHLVGFSSPWHLRRPRSSNRNPLTCLPDRSVMARSRGSSGTKRRRRVKRQASRPAFWEFGHEKRRHSRSAVRRFWGSPHRPHRPRPSTRSSSEACSTADRTARSPASACRTRRGAGPASTSISARRWRRRSSTTRPRSSSCR